MPKCAYFVPLFLSLLFRPAYADFNSNGLETFSGTTLDTTTWQSINPQFISQNNGLFMAASNNPADLTQFTTNYMAVNVGGSATVQVTMTAKTSNNNDSQFAYLGFTTNANGSPLINLGQQYALSTNIELNPETFSGNYFSGSTGTGVGPPSSTVSLNQLYTLGLDRLSATSIQYTIVNSLNQTIFNDTVTRPSFTGPLYVALGVDSINAEFNNLQLTGNFANLPEPTSATMLCAASTLLLSRRRKSFKIR